MKNLFIIAGPNGAGKTTTAMELLPNMLPCREYVNADSIAAGLSPFDPNKLAFKAGRLMLERIHELEDLGESFTFETTLSTRSFLPFLESCKSKGYQVFLLYFWLENSSLAKKRVSERVKQGGHSIPAETIERRFHRSLYNLVNDYTKIVDEWAIFDNSYEELSIIARKTIDSKLEIIDELNWEKVKEQSCQKAS